MTTCFAGRYLCGLAQGARRKWKGRGRSDHVRKLPMSRSLIVLPDDSAKPIIGAIDRAATSLRIKMFSLADPVILSALINAHKRGVKTRVMLNPARRSGEFQNR